MRRFLLEGNGARLINEYGVPGQLIGLDKVGKYERDVKFNPGKRIFKEIEAPAVQPQAKQEPIRKAGDELERAANDIIGELRDEAAYEEIVGLKDMVHGLRQRDADVSARWDGALSQAGLSREHLQHASNINSNDIQLVGNIDARTPEAIQFDWGDDNVNGQSVAAQTRLHSRNELNPLTGQMDVVPFMDADNVPMYTQFGVKGQSVTDADVQSMDSDEFLGKRMLELAGQKPRQNNDADVYAVDLINDTNNSKVDVEMIKSNELSRDGVGLQVYTEMAPASLSGAKPRDYRESQGIARQMKEELEPLIRKRMSEGLTVMDAIESLSREGVITNSGGWSGPVEGKLLKEEGRYVDQLVHPVVSNRDAALNMESARTGGRSRKYVMPLEGALLSDANAGKEALEDLSGRSGFGQLSLRPMAGNNGTRPGVKAYLQVPTSSSVVTDLGKVTPAVRQLFKTQKKTSR